MSDTRPPEALLREVLKATLSALAITVTNVPTTGRPHWCRSTGGHDPTCSGMLKTQDQARAALATPEPDLDVERLARAILAAKWYGDEADAQVAASAIAAEYARLRDSNA